MFGYYSKPLHLPKPHHHERRAGAITEVYERGMTAPREAGEVRPTRFAPERRQSRRRLAARRASQFRDGNALIAVLTLALAFWIVVAALT